MKNNILKEIDFMLEKANKILEKTDGKEDLLSKKQHIFALSKIITLCDLKYSIRHNDWTYKKGVE